MKKILLILGLLLTCAALQAQVPQAFQYQAVARDANGDCLSDILISLRISIIDDSATSNPIFEEIFSSVPTNQQGLFSIEIGTGVTQGSSPEFAGLDWNMNGQSRQLKVELSPDNNLNFIEVGMSRLLAVPYAAAAGNGLRYDQANGDEFLPWYGTNETINGLLGGGGSGDNNSGLLRLFDQSGQSMVYLRASATSSNQEAVGALSLSGPNGNGNIGLGWRNNTTVGLNRGAIRIYDENGVDKIFSRIEEGAGAITLYGDNGSANIVLGIGSGVPNIGAQTIRNENGDVRVSFGINGADQGVKNFVMAHPTQAEKQIWYACIEGPEAAAYERGTAELVNGEAEIRFSEHFEIVANPSTMTVLTSPWSAESKGLAIIERTATGFTVKELGGGTGNYQFDWEAKAVRKGFEDYEVIRDKMEEPDADIDMEDR